MPANSIEWKLSKKASRVICCAQQKLYFMVLFGCHHVHKCNSNDMTATRFDVNTECRRTTGGNATANDTRRVCTYLHGDLSLDWSCVYDAQSTQNRFHSHSRTGITAQTGAVSRYCVAPPLNRQADDKLQTELYTRRCMHAFDF